MTKRYASHFILLPGYGYLKHFAVEVDAGKVISVFPLVEEIESVEWFPGVIILLPEMEGDLTDNCSTYFPEQSEVLKELPQAFRKGDIPTGLVSYLYYPFDFTTMKPVCETRRKLLL